VRRLAEGLGLDPDARSVFLASAHARAAVGALAAVNAPSLSPLPSSPTSFAGRERELLEIRRLLGLARLLTLTGAGGIGKSRLAFELPARLRKELPDSVAVVELTAISDPGLILQALRESHGVGGRSPTSGPGGS